MKLNPAQIALRPATLADRDTAFEIKKAALGPYIAQTFGWDDAEQLRFHDDEYDPAIAMLLLYQDTPIGYYSANVDASTLHINDLYLLPAFQRHGIGGYVLRTLLQAVDTQGYAARLDVLKVNPARRLYERYGFVIVGEDAHFYHMERQAPGSRPAEQP